MNREMRKRILRHLKKEELVDLFMELEDELLAMEKAGSAPARDENFKCQGDTQQK